MGLREKWRKRKKAKEEARTFKAGELSAKKDAWHILIEEKQEARGIDQRAVLATNLKNFNRSRDQRKSKELIKDAFLSAAAINMPPEEFGAYVNKFSSKRKEFGEKSLVDWYKEFLSR